MSRTTKEMEPCAKPAARPWSRFQSTAHLLQPVIERAARDPGRAMAAYRDGDHFVDVTAGEFYERVRRLAKGLIACGVQPGDRVALMSHTRLEWLLVDYAILAAGGVTVPAYETSSAEQLQWILSDSEAVVVVVETPEMAEMYAGIADDTPSCGAVVRDRRRRPRRAGPPGRRASTTPCWTSGSPSSRRIGSPRSSTPRARPGRPKGCAITHGNLRTNVLQNLDAVRSMLEPDEVSLVFLPLAHTLTKIIALVGVEWGIKLAFATDIAHLQEELALVRPTMVVAVPRVFEKVFNGAQHKANAEGHGGIFDKSVEVGDPLVRERRDRAAPPDHQSRARRARPVGVPQAAGRLRRAHALRLQRRRPSRRAAHSLLQRHRGQDLRGLRPDRDQPDLDGQPRGRVEARHGRHTPRVDVDPHRGRRRGARQGPAGVPGVLAQRGRHRRRRSTTTDGS